ncbi:hypothetical protein GCM10018785_63710 [Streptomyces longispororuber]|uniref:Uncharacterized protein n=1 Tax=Streptomyces longispororuber TaxID=68230 RepID=A0A919DV15_9ACTN|nr:hypothetical protein [Streptomyces longispororuber]GHE87360.1 hypothetical protein GCM10018785_63710 [Streptomyces longispororuber]
MDLTPYADDSPHELAAAADAGGEDGRTPHRRPGAPQDPPAGPAAREERPARLTLLSTGPDTGGAAPPAPGGHGSLALASDLLSGGPVGLGFATAGQLESAAALFDQAVPDPAALTLDVPGDGGAPALGALEAALDGAGVEATALAARTPCLDDVCQALFGPDEDGNATGGDDAG